jgi:hypothetical protein
MNRNDIDIVLTEDGHLVVLQGSARDKDIDGEIARESGLFFSQLEHRAAWRDEGGRPVMGYPSDAPNGVPFERFRPVHLCAGVPYTVGMV